MFECVKILIFIKRAQLKILIELPIFITFENTNNRIVKNKILKEFGIHGFLIKNHEKTILKMNGYPENIIVDESQKYKNNFRKHE